AIGVTAVLSATYTIGPAMLAPLVYEPVQASQEPAPMPEESTTTSTSSTTTITTEVIAPPEPMFTAQPGEIVGTIKLPEELCNEEILVIEASENEDLTGL